MAGVWWFLTGYASGVATMCYLAHQFHTAPVMPAEQEEVRWPPPPTAPGTPEADRSK